MKQQGRLLKSLNRLTANKQTVDAQNKLEQSYKEGMNMLFKKPQSSPTLLDDEWRGYLADIRKDNQKILNEILELRKKNDRY